MKDCSGRFERVSVYGLRWLTYLLVVAALLSLCSGRVFSAQQVTIAAIKNAWQERQELLKSGRFVWTETRVEKKGWKRISGVELDPPSDLEYTRECLFLVDGDKWIYDYSTLPGRAGDLKAIVQKSKAGYNGVVSKTLDGPTEGRRFHQGDVLHKSRNINMVELLPIILGFRQPNKVLDSLANMVVTNQEGVVEGHRCVILERGDDIGGKDVLWVDPSQGFLTRRRLFVQNNSILWQVDIDYSSTTPAEGKWFPSQWSITVSGQDKAPYTITAAKLREHMINQPIAAALFEIDIPPGAVVYQDKNPEQYIQLASGGIHPFTNADLETMSYEDLLVRAEKRGFRRILIFSVLMGLVMIVAVYLLRKIRDSRRRRAG